MIWPNAMPSVIELTGLSLMQYVNELGGPGFVFLAFCTCIKIPYLLCAKRLEESDGIDNRNH